MRKEIVLFTACTVVLAAALVGCGTNKPVDEKVSSAGVAQEESTTPQSQQDHVLSIGSTGNLGDWSITLDKFEILDSVPNSYGSFKPDDGNKYAVATLTIKNNGKSANEFLPMVAVGNQTSAKIMYDGQYEYSASYLMGHTQELHNKNLNPLTSATGIVAFELPTDTANGDKPIVLQINEGVKKLIFSVK